MDEPQVRSALHVLSVAALGRVQASGKPIEGFRGIAIYDVTKDEIFTSLDEFDAAEQSLASIALLRERYGLDQSGRLALQFIYELLGRLSEPVFDEDLFESLWVDFLAELAEPQWLFRGVANVRFLRAEGHSFDLGDRVSITQRSFDDLSELGFSDAVLAGLQDDWSGFGASAYVILVDDQLDKSPFNFVMSSSATLFGKAYRALCALRLLAPGDIGIGRMWVDRVARFNVGLGGMHIVGYSASTTFGSPLLLTEEIRAEVPAMCDAIRRLETQGYGGAPGNFGLALQSFMATYDRSRAGSDSRVLDAITALEAVLASGEGEITFKLSFRVAGILAVDGAERVRIFNEMKAYYDLRSKLVHGAILKEKHHQLIAEFEQLRELVRELLRGFIHLATASGRPYSKQFFRERLDATLLDEAERDRLRSNLGLA